MNTSFGNCGRQKLKPDLTVTVKSNTDFHNLIHFFSSEAGGADLVLISSIPR